MSNYFSLGLDLSSAITNAVNTANLQGMMNSYMTNSIFSSLPSFDIGNMSLSTPAWMQNIGSTFSQYDFSSISSSNPFAGGGSYGVITDEDGEKLTMSEYAKKHGYEETMTAGVYKKDGKYYRYNASLKRFAEVSKSEAEAVKKADKDAEASKQADAYKEQLKANKSKTEAEAREIAAAVYDSVKGWGTNDSKLKNTVSRITRDNVIEVWEMWQLNHENDFGNEGGLIKSIRDDVRESQMTPYETQIKNALIQRAEALGLKDEAEIFRSANNHDYDSYDTIVAEIRNKERE